MKNINKYCLKTFVISITILVIIYSIILFFLFKYHKTDVNNWLFWLIILIIGYFILGLYPSIIYYYYAIYYPKHGFKIGHDPLGEFLSFILCGYYAIKFYVNREEWYKGKIKMMADKETNE